MRLLLDINSMLNAALLGGVDVDGRKVTDENGRTHQVNTAAYGVDKFFMQIDELCREFDAAPRDMVAVLDGKNAKLRRQAFLPTYKAGRDKVDEVSAELNAARELVTKTMLGLGAHVAQQTGYEADDVIGYICKTVRNERNVVVTSDGDLTVLVDENTDVWRLGKMSENPYGPFAHKYITLYKALVGDSSDKIPGAKGFGDVAWCDLCRVFGLDSLEEFQRMIVEGCLHELKDNVPDLKVLQKVIDAAPMVTTSWRVASLLVDEINTCGKPWDLQAGMTEQWGASEFQPSELKRFYGTKTLVTADNYRAVYERLSLSRFAGSPFVALDIETSSSEESDEWMERLMKATESDRERIDVLGHELTGMSLTFGQNTQHTLYMSVNHKDSANITVDQCRMMCELIPHHKLHTIVQNRNFEFSVLYRTWGDKWMENGWHGFLPNALDTKIGASYVDENLKKGLKQRSLHHLGYTQTSYEETTTLSGPVGSLRGGQLRGSFKKEVAPAVFREVVAVVDDEWTDDDGVIHQSTVEEVRQELVTPAVTEDWEARQYKMRELTAAQVFDYGCDDTICTAALHTHYKFVMDLEHTWETYLAVETLPEYLTTLAFVQGIPVSMQTLTEMERADDASYDQAWRVLREYLMAKGWEGTCCPEFETSIEPSDAKLAVSILVSEEFGTRKRKLEGIALDIREQFPDNDTAALLANIVEANNVPELNALVKRHFTGEPKINFGSPKQMQHLFYEVLGMTPRIVNKMTDNQRTGDLVMASAFKKRRQLKEGKQVEYTPEELKSLISKCSTDDSAVTTALALDDLGAREKAVLKAYSTVREVMTRRNLFYKTYRAIPHWRDGRIHPSLNQSEAVTRRYSASGPNIQQLSARGEGAKLREVLLAHKRDAVVVSLDFSGQELRLGAELSGDEAMTSCYVGDNLRDMHSLTAVAAALLVLGEEISYEQFQKNRKSDDKAVADRADGLRGKAKTVNFAAQYGGSAVTVAQGLMSSEEVAQSFLDAREAAFPGIVAWDEKVRADAKECGYSLTMMGARRHLREALASDNKWDVLKAERQVGNFWIQSSAAEMSKLAMARVWRSGVCTTGLDCKFYFPVHDELVLSVSRMDAVEVIQKVHACMVARYSTMTIPLESSIAIGKSFACEVEVGTAPSREAIEKALAAVFDAKVLT